jgi:flagellar basal body-associated protein FliL
MDNVILSIVIVVLFIGTMLFLYFMNSKRDRAEKERLREVVVALKSKDIQEYETALPPLIDVDLPTQEQDELIPLEEVEPEELLK